MEFLPPLQTTYPLPLNPGFYLKCQMRQEREMKAHYQTSHWISVDHIGHTMRQQSDFVFRTYNSLKKSSLVWWWWGNKEKLVCFLQLVCNLKLAMILNWEGNYQTLGRFEGNLLKTTYLFQPSYGLTSATQSHLRWGQCDIFFSSICSHDKGMGNNQLD